MNVIIGVDPHEATHHGGTGGVLYPRVEVAISQSGVSWMG